MIEREDIVGLIDGDRSRTTLYKFWPFYLAIGETRFVDSWRFSVVFFYWEIAISVGRTKDPR